MARKVLVGTATPPTNGYLLPENVTPLYLQWGILVTGFDLFCIEVISVFKLGCEHFYNTTIFSVP